jgi:energy-coupling factor transport system permease protein
VGLLVSAIRHGDRLALSMDARGFGSGPRTAYRVVRWSVLDAVVGLGAIAVLALAMAVAR